MYASVTSGQIQQGQIDEYVKIWEEQIMPEVKNLAGIVNAYFCINRETHKGITLAIYETEADATATQTSGKYRALLSQLAPMLVMDTITREGYEVRLHL
jgi:hypothetical protein